MRADILRIGRAALLAALLVAGGNSLAARAQTGTAPSAAAKASSSYAKVKTIDLPGTRGGTGGGVAFDADTATIWLSQAANRNLVVIETGANDVRQVIEGVDPAREIGFSEHYVFIGDAADAAALVIGKRSFEKAAALKPVGARPGPVYFDTRQGQLWVASAGGEMTVFKAVGRGGFKHLAGLKLHPHPPAGTLGNGLYLPLKDRLYQPVDDVIDVINPKSLKLEHVWSAALGGRVTSLAYDAKADRLLAVGEAAAVVVIDARSGKPVGRAAIRGKAGAIATDSALRRAYVADAAGLVEVLDLDHDALVASFASEPGVHALAVDPRTHYVYVYRSRANKLEVFAPR